MTFVLFHVGSRRVVDTTYFSRALIRSASPASFGASGQNVAQI